MQTDKPPGTLVPAWEWNRAITSGYLTVSNRGVHELEANSHRDRDSASNVDYGSNVRMRVYAKFTHVCEVRTMEQRYERTPRGVVKAAGLIEE
jgi:hypothetical protein